MFFERGEGKQNIVLEFKAHKLNGEIENELEKYN